MCRDTWLSLPTPRAAASGSSWTCHMSYPVQTQALPLALSTGSPCSMPALQGGSAPGQPFLHGSSAPASPICVEDPPLALSAVRLCPCLVFTEAQPWLCQQGGSLPVALNQQVPEAFPSHLASNVSGLITHGHPGDAGEVNECQIRDVWGADLQVDKLRTDAQAFPGNRVLG